MRADAQGMHPDLEWATSGAMALTGAVDGPPLLAPAPLATAARAAVAAISNLVATSTLLDASSLRSLDAPALLGERAAIFAHTRRGSTSVGGTCHLLRCADGWIAANLARPEDVALLPAWLGEGRVTDARAFVAARARERNVDEVVARARLLGLPVAPVSLSDDTAGLSDWLLVATRGPSRDAAPVSPPLVIDLSSLWAGPLCTHLLALAGARVIKVESIRRPDGARRGPPGFFDLINDDKRSVALDFASHADVCTLRSLIEVADIVVESSRPRALRQLGIVAEDIVATQRGLIWVSITGYGRAEPMGDWVAFGDDAAAAAGIVVPPPQRGSSPLFCADAVADPLTGIHAALAALTRWRSGDGVLLDVALQRVAAFVGMQAIASPRGRAYERRHADGAREWEVGVGSERCTVAPPRARTARKPAPSLGADTRTVLAELGIRC